MKVVENLAGIRTKIEQACDRVDRSPNDITIIGVTKYVTIDRAKETFAAGITNLGENRLEGLLEKQAELEEDVHWHFIGSLQSRKVKDIIDKVDFIHSLDRQSLAKEINKRASKHTPCFVQVNISGETSKHGLSKDEVIPFIEKLASYPHIQVVGLMTMAPFTEDEALIRNTFRELRLLRDKIMANNWQHAPCSFLSMGMSNDYMIAIEEGATHIRIGSELVGPYDN